MSEPIPQQCPVCRSDFRSTGPMRYPEDDNRIRTAHDYGCGSFYVDFDGELQFNQVHVCEIKSLRSALSLCRTELAYLVDQLPSRGFGITSVKAAYDAASAVLDA